MHRWSNHTQCFLEPCGLSRERPMRQAYKLCRVCIRVDQSSFVCSELRISICQLDSFCRIVPIASSSTSSASSSLRYHNRTKPGLLPSATMRVGMLVVRCPECFKRSRAVILRKLQNGPWLCSLDVLIIIWRSVHITDKVRFSCWIIDFASMLRLRWVTLILT